MDNIKIYRILADEGDNQNTLYSYVAVDDDMSDDDIRRKWAEYYPWFKMYECELIEDEKEAQDIFDNSPMFMF